MLSHETYGCAADCLINLYRHFGRQAISALQRLGKKGGLKILESVVREIIRGTDNLAKFAKREQGSILLTVGDDPRLRAEIARLERH